MDPIALACLTGGLQAIIQVLFERLVPQNNFIEFCRSKLLPNHGNNKILFDNLISTLKLLGKALSDDAVEKQLMSQTNREWLECLTHAVNQTADLLDEIYSRVLAESQPIAKSALDKIIQNSQVELKKMTENLERLAKVKDVYGSKESSRKKKMRVESTSLVYESEIYGRDEDKQKILNFLVEESDQRYGEKSDQRVGKDIPLIAIIGMAGIGKTTLAQLLFNDSVVKSCFSHRAWVHVSEDMDVLKVTNTLYEKVTDQTSDIQNLDTLQIKLVEKLKNKQFLFVFDDVWNEHHHTWVELQKVLKGGAPGSRIIVTTRSQEVASTMCASQTYHLQPLSDEDCWSLFAKQAFGSPHIDTPQKPIDRDIIKKCGGLPLVARELGSLCSKVDAEEWENIVNGNLFDLPDNMMDILAPFRLSFNHLSSPFLKQCFAHCSIIPKGCSFDREKLILLWMAQGFLPQLKSGGELEQLRREMERVGITYFKELLAKSFFQHEREDDESPFVMHDLINELAQFASIIQSCLVEQGKSPNISDKTRHVSYVCRGHDKGTDLIDVLRKAESLWTFIQSSLFKKVTGSRSSSIGMQVVEELGKQKRLRVLSLSYRNNKLPDEFGQLRHLRYLDLSGSEFKNLPETISKLYFLQTLILSRCRCLERLPDEMANLIYLGHLDLTETTALKMMPPAIGKLKSLRVLTNFVVSNSSKASRIKELGDLLLLGGKLSILNLQNVKDKEDAENAKLKEKNVKELKFEWSSNVKPDPEEVLENLCPPKDIEKLSIAGYGGTRLPNWLGYSSFSKMVSLYLSNCRNCSSLPSLRQLSSLQKLCVDNMPNCGDWVSSPVTGGGSLSLPLSLQTLSIIDCVKLTPQTAWGLGNITSLTHLKIDCAYDDNVLSFPIDGLFPPSLTHLHILNFQKLETLNLKGLQHLISLNALQITNCDQLKILSDGILPDSLSYLCISGCPLLTDSCRDQDNYWKKISPNSVKIINGKYLD